MPVIFIRAYNMWPPNGIAPFKTLLALLALCLVATFSEAAAVVDVKPTSPTTVSRADGRSLFALQVISLPTYKPSMQNRPLQKDSVPSESNGQPNRIAVASAVADSDIELVHPKRATSSVQSIPSTKSIQAAADSTESGSKKNANAIPIDEKPSSLSAPSSTVAASKSVRGTAPSDAYECPKDEYFQLFPTRCTKHSECKPRNSDEFRCCKQIGGRRCVKAVARPLPEPKHEPILGVIPRKCPREPLAELFWDLQTCDSDRDCWPRVCCPDGARKYCRTAQPELDKSTLSVARQLSTPLESVSRYIQCTPPPPAVFDQFPKKCNSTLDCFPNVCCQEAGRKHCRPPRRSLLSLLTGFASNFNTGIIRQWTQSIVIR